MAGTTITNKVITELLTRVKGTNSITKSKAALQELNEKTKTSKQLLLEEVRATAAANIAKAQLAARNRQVAALMKQTGLTANQLARGMKTAGYNIDKTGKVLNAFGQKVKKADINLKQIKRSSMGFNMNMLSLMFASMALNRAMGTFLRSTITAFQRANEDTEGLGKATWHLSAAWEFFKYSLVDALTQSGLFQVLVDKLTTATNRFNGLSQGTKAFIMTSVGIIFFLSLITMIVGQVGLAINGFKDLGILIKGMFTKKALIGFGKFILWLAVAILLGIALKGAIFGFSKEFDDSVADWQKNGGIMAKIVGGLVRLFHLGGSAIGLLFRAIWTSWIGFIESMLNTVIMKLNFLVKMLNKIPGVSIPLIPKVDFGVAGLKANLLRDTLELAENAPNLQQIFTGETPNGNGNKEVNVSEININMSASNEIFDNADELVAKLNEQLGETLSGVVDSANN